MIGRRSLLRTAATLALAISAPLPISAAESFPVVTTFSILGDMTQRIGGSHVAVKSLVGPDGDAHVYQPTPADARVVAKARVLIVNGLGFEGWLDRLTRASGFAGTRVVASAGIEPLPAGEDHDHEDEKPHADAHAHGHGKDKAQHHDHGHHHGAFDPHAWQSLKNAVVYAGNIAAALAKADPAHAAVYEQNRAAYVAEIEALDAEIRTLVAALPEERRTVITSHDAFGYFEAAYGIRFRAPQGVSTEAEASAADVAALIRQIREEKIRAVFVETISDRRLLDQIARETGAAIGGALYSDALSGPAGPAATYLDMFRHNARTLTSALGS